MKMQFSIRNTYIMFMLCSALQMERTQNSKCTPFTQSQQISFHRKLPLQHSSAQPIWTSGRSSNISKLCNPENVLRMKFNFFLRKRVFYTKNSLYDLKLRTLCTLKQAFLVNNWNIITCKEASSQFKDYCYLIFF